jgi:erythromycin esterase
MAQNIKWILDQNPKAKIVLWAHNGHVAKNFGWGYKTMGSSLREMFGEQMVVFGFAFNQGSFQAIERGKGLHDFTVAPAPAGSLDATLAATGIPLLAIDLRRFPKAVRWRRGGVSHINRATSAPCTPRIWITS